MYVGLQWAVQWVVVHVCTTSDLATNILVRLEVLNDVCIKKFH